MHSALGTVCLLLIGMPMALSDFEVKLFFLFVFRVLIAMHCSALLQWRRGAVWCGAVALLLLLAVWRCLDRRSWRGRLPLSELPSAAPLRFDCLAGCTRLQCTRRQAARAVKGKEGGKGAQPLSSHSASAVAPVIQPATPPANSNPLANSTRSHSRHVGLDARTHARRGSGVCCPVVFPRCRRHCRSDSGH